MLVFLMNLMLIHLDTFRGIEFIDVLVMKLSSPKHTPLVFSLDFLFFKNKICPPLQISLPGFGRFVLRIGSELQQK